MLSVELRISSTIFPWCLLFSRVLHEFSFFRVFFSLCKKRKKLRILLLEKGMRVAHWQHICLRSRESRVRIQAPQKYCTASSEASTAATTAAVAVSAASAAKIRKGNNNKNGNYASSPLLQYSVPELYVLGKQKTHNISR